MASSKFDTERGAVAHANNDSVHIAWSFGKKALAGCVGFAIYRITKSERGESEPVALPAMSRDLDGDGVLDRQTTADRPVTKFAWRDPFVQRDTEVRYRIVPMGGDPEAPEPLPASGESRPLLTHWVAVSEKASRGIDVYFNRGFLATQATARRILDPRTKKPSRKKLEEGIAPGGNLRGRLAAEMTGALLSLLERAKRDGGTIYAALYELTDPELIAALSSCERLKIVLANNNGSEEDLTSAENYDTKNAAAWKALKKAARDSGVDRAGEKKVQVFRRFLPSGRIGHNKVLIYVDREGTPRAVLTGSTNWTSSGLCTQSNNTLVFESRELAALYLESWQALRDDTIAAGLATKAAPVKGLQSAELRAANAEPRPVVDLGRGRTVRVWFSPNTPKLVPKVGAELPPDLAEVWEILERAKQSVLFLAFMPGKAGSLGSQHLVKRLATLAAEKPRLFVRGAVSDPGLVDEFDQATFASETIESATVVSPAGMVGDFEDWLQEIYKYGHAVVHDKTIVVDPWSADCAVITGSHNLGFRASHNNDENLVILRGDRAVAAAYATHVMDVVEHYRWRWFEQKRLMRLALAEVGGDRKKVTPDLLRRLFRPSFDGSFNPDWQERYFDSSRPARLERLFWISEGEKLPPLAVRRAGRRGGNR